MRNAIILSFVLLFCFSVVHAQEETLFGESKITHGGYGGPELKLTQINGEWGLAVGGRGGWIISNSLSLGGGGYGIVTNHKVDDQQNTNSDILLNVGWGGGFIEYINSSNQVFHFTVNSLIGAGDASYYLKDDESHWNNTIGKSSSFFVFEPGITIDVNLLKFFRISLGASYRYVSGLELFNPDGSLLTEDKDLSGLGFNICFKFGKF